MTEENTPSSTPPGQKPLEDYMEEYVMLETKKKHQFTAKNIALAGGLVALLVGGIYLIQSPSYQWNRLSPDAIPTVKADKTPVKKAPQDPGGMQIPNQDKKIYTKIESNGSKEPLPKVVKILPAPEKPLNMNEYINQQKKEKSLESAIKQGSINIEQAAIPTPNNSSRSIKRDSKKIDNVTKKTLPSPVVSSTKVTPPVEAVKESVQTITKTAKNYSIQLGAFKNRQDASSEFDRINKRAGNIFADEKYRIEKADLGIKGIFYRLKAGQYNSSEEAKATCSRLQQDNINCFVVKNDS